MPWGRPPAVLVLAFALFALLLPAHIQAADTTGTGAVGPVVVVLPDPADPRTPGDSLAPAEDQRLVAAALALFLGPFGAHRLYFGTTAKVPIIYGITFGGFGILAVIDLGHILFTKDLSRYRDCDRVFMWGRPKPATTPP